MIDLICEESDYLQAIKEMNQTFRVGADIIENPFNNDISIYLGFEFDKLYDKLFYEGLQHFLNKLCAKEFLLHTLLPEPDKYFFNNFSKYSVVRVANIVPYEEYIELLNLDPGNSPADALIHNSETVAIYSDVKGWGIIGSKDLELAIVGFNDAIVESMFLDCFDKDIFTDIKTFLDDIDTRLILQPETEEIHSKILESYYKR